MPRVRGTSAFHDTPEKMEERLEGVLLQAAAPIGTKNPVRATVTVTPIEHASKPVVGIAGFARAAEIFASKDSFHAVSPDQYEAQWKRLDALGYMRAAEYISSGMLPWAFAQKFGVSHMVFREWWDKGPAEIVQRALVNHAEASAVMSEMVLQVYPDSKETAAVQTELSKLYRWRAERIGGKQFNAGKQKADTAKPLHIRISHKIPGLEHIWGGGDRSGSLAPPSPVTIDLDTAEITQDG